MAFHDCDTAHFWGITIDEFWEKSKDIQVLMTAYAIARGKMQTYVESKQSS